MRKKIRVNKTAFYHTLGTVKTAQTIWIVLHGYGYLAEYFIKKFEPILDNTTAVIAPEGLSKFYLKGVGHDGRIGASWMTKDNRLEEIEDYIAFLNQLYAEIVKENEMKQLKINVLGFSQGGATACRWIAHQTVKCDNLILWSSSLPTDVDFNKLTQNNKLYALFGDDDEFITEAQITEYEKHLQLKEVECQLIRFKGKHTIPKQVLLDQSNINNWVSS
mgnify:CR=1 FL=1